MSNLKKILALVLALVMSFSLVTVSSAAFADIDDVDATYAEAVEVLSALGVFNGRTATEFAPNAPITRAEVAAIIYRVVTGDVTGRQVAVYSDFNVFSDVPSTAWYAGYVNYCANAQYVKGVGEGKFAPDAQVTGYQALAMILRAVGYDKNNEFTGPAWQVETAKIGTTLNITRNLSAVTLGVAATRETVAEILFRAIMVPQVTYTLALGYSQYDTTSSLLAPDMNPSLAEANFGLTTINGVIEGTYRAAGVTYIDVETALGTVTYTVENTDANWENIGYAAYVYAVPTANAKTYTAISSVNVYGQSLGVVTNGTAYNTTYSVWTGDVDTDAVFYINGVEVTEAEAITAATNKVGVKVDFVDNDFGGLAESVIVTDYTVDVVTGIANDYNAGTNAIVKNTYYFTTGAAVKAANIVCDETLAVNDLVTYVVYNRDYYVVKAPYTAGVFTKINFANITPVATTYVIGGTEYAKAADFVEDATYLDVANVGRNTIVATDPYGYMLVVGPNVAATQYLYVIRANHTDRVNNTTLATVAFADGTVENVYVSNLVDSFADIKSELYTYTERNGVYYLTQFCNDTDIVATTNVDESDNHFEDVTYLNGNKNTVTLTTGLYLNNNSVVVDLRPVIGRYGSAVVYTGYAQIPSVVEGDFHVVATDAGFVTLAFLTAGANTADLSMDFMLYATGYNYYEIDENYDCFYYMNAIVDTQIVEIKLDADQYADVQNHGVGIYSYNENGELSYTSFEEDWYNVTWSNGTIIVDTQGAFAYGDATFYTLDIANGKAYNYIMTAGQDMTNAKAYVVYDRLGNVVEIYVVYGEVATGSVTYTNADGDTFVVAAGKVTDATRA